MVSVKKCWQEKALLSIIGVGLAVSALLYPSWLNSSLLLLLLLHYYFFCCRRSEKPGGKADPVFADECSVLLQKSPENTERVAGQGPRKEVPFVHCNDTNAAVFAFIQIDNLEDVRQGLDENQRNALQTETQKCLMTWTNRFGGFLRKYSEDMYLGIFARAEMDRIISDRFDILDEVRALRVGNKMPVTVSMGISAYGQNMSERSQKAQRGLDLALGRGGDQAAVYLTEEVQFYGGKAKVMEKNTRVKARVVAHAIRELMQEASEIMIMGHDGEDFDSLGSSMGVARMATHLGKKVNIVVGDVGLSFKKLEELLPDYSEYVNLFIDQERALSNVSAKTLLFVVDTHRVFLTAAPKLINAVERRVVIDHHRRAEDFIPSPIIVYLEPSASSTSELVSELLIYFDEKIEMTRLDASAMYAGIVLDTKNFAVQTGVRTFEAAAYLRRSGADPAMVRHLFRVDMDTLKVRAQILSGAQLLDGGIVIAICPSEVKNAQIIAAQAADLMVSIEGVRVSFVLWPAEDGVGISARSNGGINVQVIMEAFAGGGHQTVAGAHIPGVDVTEARRRLDKVVAEYIGEAKG